MKVSYQLSDENFNDSQDENSLWIRFDLDQKISQTTKSYTTSQEAQISPLGSKIFGFPWVEQIKISPEALLIQRQDWVDFEIIAEPLKDLIGEHFNNLKDSKIEENPKPQAQKSTPTYTHKLTDEEKLVIQFLDENINPQVSSHGGKISFVKLEDHKLFVKMEGGCQGCSMAQATLKEGVETSLKENFSFISEVVDLTDHNQGLNPFL